MRFDRVIAVRNDKTVYRDSDRCIKVFSPAYSKADVFGEALNQVRIEETGLNVPKIMDVTMFDGKWAIVSEYIRGKTLEQCMEEDPQHAEQYLQMLIDEQSRIHQETALNLNKQRAKLHSKISQTQLDVNLRRNLHMRLNGFSDQNRICHGDFVPSNLILDRDGRIFVLDWAHVTQGDHAADVARTYLHFLYNDQKELAERYMEQFCFKNDLNQFYVKKWIPIISAARSVSCGQSERSFMLRQAAAEEYN